MGSGCINPDGYKQITICGKPVREHRVVMSSFIGRPLRLNEIIHHKNGIRTDNRIQNLSIRLQGHAVGQTIRERVEDLRRLGCKIVVPRKIKLIWN